MNQARIPLLFVPILTVCMLAAWSGSDDEPAGTSGSSTSSGGSGGGSSGKNPGNDSDSSTPPGNGTFSLEGAERLTCPTKDGHSPTNVRVGGDCTGNIEGAIGAALEDADFELDARRAKLARTLAHQTLQGRHQPIDAARCYVVLGAVGDASSLELVLSRPPLQREWKGSEKRPLAALRKRLR